MNKTLLLAGSVLLYFCLLTAQVQANPALTIGHKTTIQSKILKEQRELLIYLPSDYGEAAERRYPVLYTLDGNTHFKRVVGTMEWLSESASMIPQHIVVAIVNTDRFRDLSPSVPKDYSGDGNPGGADNFLRFLASELVPHIDKNYRTQPFRTLAGHSFGGLFTLHALMQKPNLFQAYISQSPHIIFDDAELVTRLDTSLKRDKSLFSFLYLTLGNEPNRRDAYDRLINILDNKAPPALEWSSHIYPLETHMSTPSKTLHNALLAMRSYAGWQVEPELLSQGFSAVKAHYQKLSKNFGFDIAVPEVEINRMGYSHYALKEFAKAIEIFRLNIKLYPNSINAQDSLAEALEGAGDLTGALKVQQTAVTMAKQQNSLQLTYLEGRLQQLQSKLANNKS